MRYITIVIMILALLLSGCSGVSQTNDNRGEDINLSGGEPSAYEVMQQDEQGVQDKAKCDINFVYHNNFYGYDLEATWSDVLIKKTNTNLSAEIYGLEILFDNTVGMYEDLDTNGNEYITENEWTELEADFPFKKYDIDANGNIDNIEFTGLSQRLGGIDVYPTGFKITQPTMKDYKLELNNDEGPVSIKILRASTPGFKGAYNYYFPKDTIFIELASDFRIFIAEADDMDVTSAFDYPLLNMYVDDGKEIKNSYSHGAMGFTSVVDTDAFNRIFVGKVFSLKYEAYYENKIVGTYELIIKPK